MAIRLEQKKLYTSKGKYLKTLSCPQLISHSELQMIDSGYRQYHCASCQKAILNTDMLTEQEIEEVLTNDPEACVYINPLNPVFDVIFAGECDISL